MPDLVWGILIGLAVALLVRFALGRLTSFRAQKVEDYAETTPAFEITRHLGGAMECEGLIHGPRGRVVSRFTARMEGSWTGRAGTLREHFTYADGSTQEREWAINMIDDVRFEATAEDIIGTAEGRISGGALLMRYRLRLPEDAGGHVLNVTDWLYLTPSGVILNRSEMRKFGLKVAELTATMRPARAEERAVEPRRAKAEAAA
ncbi:DUF3833 domain-containing protein [Vannielia sp. SX4]|uniref:DUF3833 domain-containing protein n=1 Tax=Vannielia sp. SX4 TaxID=3463852 RepID=UPI00405831E0